MHLIDKHHSLFSCFCRASMIHTIHFFTVIHPEHHVMPGTCYLPTLFDVFLQHRVIFGFREWSKGMIGSGVPYRVILPPEKVGGVHHVNFIVMLESKRPLGPS